MSHWTEAWLGKQWTEQHDCWYWARRIWREQYAIDVPNIQIDTTDSVAVSKAFTQHPELSRWRLTRHPQDGDGVYLQPGDQPLHIGIYVDVDGGCILHGTQSKVGIALTSIAESRLNGWQHLSFYRHR